MITLIKRLVYCIAVIFAFGCAHNAAPPSAVPISPTLPTADETWGWQPIARDDLHFLLPNGFVKKASFENMGSGTYEVGYYLEGQTTMNWDEAIRVVGYRGYPPDTKTPAKQVLENIATQIRNACPADFIYEAKPLKSDTRVAAVMGCRKLFGDNTRSVFGYYLTEQGPENVYMFIHESRQASLAPDAALPQDTLARWQMQINRSLICRRGGACAIKLPPMKDFASELIPLPQKSEVNNK